MQKLILSMKYAIHGITYAVQMERNLKIQLGFFTMVLAGLYLFHIPKSEILAVLGISALVFSLELANTAVERLADEVSPDHKMEIGIIKDMMAGAVMVASMFAIIIGLMVFHDPLMHWIKA